MPVLEVAHKFVDSERTDDVKTSDSTTFEGLMLSKETLEGLKASGFVKPSPVQLRGIPLGKCGLDLIVEAKSGTGKTAVFGIIALEMIIKNGGFQVLILAPTREIAAQIGQVLKSIGSGYTDLNTEIVMGGTDINNDIRRLKMKKFQILVGSPGRVVHLIKNGCISTRLIRLLVLDEADKLTEDSFIKEINYIYSRLPERKQIIATSATYTSELRQFLEKYMKSPSHICPHISSVLLGITQYTVIVPSHKNADRQNKIKLNKLMEMICQITFKQCLVFCQYQIRAQSICEHLCQAGWHSNFLAANQDQKERLHSLHQLQTFSCRILVATDLAARGIDASNVDLVINIDIPFDCATYLHRIGRSGRYGSKGTAITILSEDEEPSFIEMCNIIGDFNIERLNINDRPSKPTEVTNGTNQSNVSLINPEKNEVPLETFDGLIESLNTFTINDSEAKQFNTENLDMKQYLKLDLEVVSTSNEMINNELPIDKMKANNFIPNKAVNVNSNECDGRASNKKSRDRTKSHKRHNHDYNAKRRELDHWMQQLNAMSAQIYQMEYINTLFNIDNRLTYM